MRDPPVSALDAKVCKQVQVEAPALDTLDVGHGVQAVLPAASAYVFAPHTAHEAEPVELAKDPEAQRVQAAEPAVA